MQVLKEMTAYRVSLRERIIEKAMQDFSMHGIRAVKMDDLATELSISKRTLYETFPNKHDLICDVIKYNQEASNAKFVEIFEQSSNSFEALMGVYTVARDFIQKTSQVFLTDIKRLYPEAFNEYKNQEISHILSLAKIIRQAKDEGLALPGIKCKIAAFLL